MAAEEESEEKKPKGKGRGRGRGRGNKRNKTTEETKRTMPKKRAEERLKKRPMGAQPRKAKKRR